MKPHKVVLAVCVCACIAYVHASCAAMKSAGDAVAAEAWPIAGGAGGAAIGSIGGPPGMIIGAGIGAGIASGIGQNAELRSGSLTGDGAEAQHLADIEHALASVEKKAEAAEKGVELASGAADAAHALIGENRNAIASTTRWIMFGSVAAFVLWFLSHHPRIRALIIPKSWQASPAAPQPKVDS